MNFLLRILLAGALLAAFPAATLAQGGYPTKPVRMILGFPAGGTTDIIARLVGQKLSERLSQPVIIDNRGGAGGTIGTDIAARANADGYTLTMGTTTTHIIAPAVYAKVKYDAFKDFVPITLVASMPNLLVLNVRLQAKSLKEFIALAKSQPGRLNYGSGGVGTTSHLTMELLKMAAGMDIVHVPYAGAGLAGNALMGGQVQVLFGSMPAVLPHAKTGRMRPIAVGTAKRSPALPDVPTVDESGYPGFEVSLWLGVFAPRGTPAAIVSKLHAELVKIAQSPEMKEQFERAGAESVTTSQAEFVRLMKVEQEKYTKVVKAANIRAK